jgi:uncharacterized membrane protein YdjX (TVP38/TMEM64 family)
MKPLLRAGTLALALSALAVVALRVPLPQLSVLRVWVTGLGPAAPVVFLLGYAVAVLAPVPKSVLSAVAGLAFGVPLGIVLVLAGASLGALGAFAVGRALGRDAVSRYAPDGLARLDSMLQRHGMLAALVVRWVPVLPFTVLNYACGVTAMRWRHYTVGTVVGLAPGTVALVVIGNAGTGISPWALIAGSVGLAAVSLTVAAVRRRRPARAQA